MAGNAYQSLSSEYEHTDLSVKAAWTLLGPGAASVHPGCRGISLRVYAACVSDIRIAHQGTDRGNVGGLQVYHPGGGCGRDALVAHLHFACRLRAAGGS